MTAALVIHLQGPPVVAGRLAVDRTLAGQRDVRLAVGIDQRVRVVHVDTLPARADGREIQIDIGKETQRGIVGEVQVDIALERDGAGVEDTVGDDDGAAALQADRHDGQVDGFVGGMLGIIGHGAEVRNGHGPVGETDLGHFLDNLVGLLPGIGRIGGTGRQDQRRREGIQNFFHDIRR